MGRKYKKRQTTLSWGGFPPSSLSTPRKPAIATSNASLVDSDDDQQMPVTPRKALVLAAVVITKQPKPDSATQTVVDGASDEAEDEEQDEGPVPGSAKRRKSLKVVDDDEEEEAPVQSPAKRRRIERKTVDSDDDEDEDEAPIQSSVRRRRLSSLATVAKNGDDEKDQEGADDTDDSLILSSRRRRSLLDDTQETIDEPAPRSNKKKARFQDTLALLRARRERIKSGEPLDSEQGSAEEADESSSDGDELPLAMDLDAELDDFIESDDEGNELIGAPDAQVPIHLTAAARAPNSENFRIYAEFLVFDTLLPSRYRSEGRVALAVRHLDTTLSTLAESVAGSGAWQAKYIRALKSRPRLEKTTLGSGWTIPHCDACNRNNQNCTVKVRFTGKRYKKDTLEDLSSDEDDASEDSNGEELPKETEEFHLGWMCRARSENAHRIAHWRKTLKNVIVEELQERGYIDEDGNVGEEIEQMTDEDKHIWADSVHQEMRERITDLYSEFAAILKEAKKNLDPRYMSKRR
ncbi:hypothetical protein FN846DRAFT_531361 [Sphaerosporella brunnea]|uniref:DUF4211 domain-containing protein n=1 Tax=Sphaerosporella brunnea TaxID=1250544 RepID=A0A5J5F2N1_9PEZI|nr:hypothetical protein FN846DRAFT_531361 [Sphaerosporella brunnea]